MEDDSIDMEDDSIDMEDDSVDMEDDSIDMEDDSTSNDMGYLVTLERQRATRGGGPAPHGSASHDGKTRREYSVPGSRRVITKCMRLLLPRCSGAR